MFQNTWEIWSLGKETDVQDMKKSSEKLEKLLKWMPVTAEWLTQGVDNAV